MISIRDLPRVFFGVVLPQTVLVIQTDRSEPHNQESASSQGCAFVTSEGIHIRVHVVHLF